MTTAPLTEKVHVNGMSLGLGEIRKNVGKCNEFFYSIHNFDSTRATPGTRTENDEFYDDLFRGFRFRLRREDSRTLFSQLRFSSSSCFSAGQRLSLQSHSGGRARKNK